MEKKERAKQPERGIESQESPVEKQCGKSSVRKAVWVGGSIFQTAKN
jgi:hypothetical protein